MNIKKFNMFNEDLSDSGIPKEFMDKAKEGKPTPSQQEFMRAGMESFQIINDVKRKESRYSNEQLEQIALSTVKKLFANNKAINIDDVNFDLEIKPLPPPPHMDRPETSMKRGVKKGMNDEDFKEEREKETDENKSEIDKRRIINALTQGFAQASQEDIIMSDENELPSELFQDYFRLMKVTHNTHWTIPEELESDTDTKFKMYIPLGRNEVIYNEESGTYTIKAEASILIVLIHEMIKGMYELLAMFGQVGKTAEELEKVYKLTDTLAMEDEGLKFGPEMIRELRTFYNNLEDKLIKNGKILQKNDILALLLAKLYMLPAREFVSICEQLFSQDETKKPYDFFAKMYLESIGNETKDIQPEIKKESPRAKPVSNKAKILNIDDILDKISATGYDSLSQEEKEFLDKQQ